MPAAEATQIAPNVSSPDCTLTWGIVNKAARGLRSSCNQDTPESQDRIACATELQSNMTLPTDQDSWLAHTRLRILKTHVMCLGILIQNMLTFCLFLPSFLALQITSPHLQHSKACCVHSALEDTCGDRGLRGAFRRWFSISLSRPQSMPRAASWHAYHCAG